MKRSSSSNTRTVRSPHVNQSSGYLVDDTIKTDPSDERIVGLAAVQSVVACSAVEKIITEHPIKPVATCFTEDM